MTKRVTIVMDDDIYKKLRNIHAKMIAKTSDSISFSKVINQTLAKALK